ncbi:MAG: chemotaxis response regulator protein-glutamate methylesterase [Pseudomonadota bacterium]|nr:chemotaxis response regulator protein-glutamate methylesterase [Pseudomonadota bacterium]
MKKIKVLVIDDSALIRKMLKEVFESTSDIEVVGVASDPYIARDKIKQLNPDVITLDIEMPRMDGLQFLSNLMRLRPMPVVMVSTLTEKGAPETLEALELGAIDYICKPNAKTPEDFDQFAHHLCDKVRIASGARVMPLESARRAQAQSRVITRERDENYRRMIAIGSSTGGTEAIAEVLSSLPVNCPPVVISQHIPELFSASLAKRLNNRYPMEVMEAENDLEVKSGRVIIAKGGQHLRFRRKGDTLYTILDDGPKQNLHRPSVEAMFDSLGQVAGAKRLVAVMLTGMGADGAMAMKRLHDAGALTMAQDEASSVVWGMPKAAFELGAIDELVTLTKVAEQIMKKARQA